MPPNPTLTALAPSEAELIAGMADGLVASEAYLGPSEAELDRMIANWVGHLPLSRPHCSCCRKARVCGEPGRPEARCDITGKTTPLYRLIRLPRPHSFGAARHCADFEPAE